uniref:Mitochondrial inner membrane protein Mpv17 n=1 Tax=Cacopsylla melanoneura TaxID=428564 RepID=A0A8D8V2B5_9HEMI
MHFLRRVLHSYKNLLTHRPYTVQAVQTASLMGIGDLIAQTFIEGHNIMDINPVRTLQYSVVGLVVGPTVGKWYQTLERMYGKEAVLKKVLTDQLVFSPVFIAVLVTSLNLLQGANWETAVANVRASYVDIILTGYQIWPLVQVVNFYFVPIQYRVLLVQAVAVVWNTYLSWKLNSIQSNSSSLTQDSIQFK